MYFDLTEDQKMLRGQLCGLLSDRLADTALMKRYDADDTFDSKLWTELSAMGLAGILVPEDKGGSAMDLLTLAVVAEELGRAAAPVPLIANALAAWLLAQGGEHDADVGSLLSGKAVAAFALAGPAGWQPQDWVISGETVTTDFGAVEWGVKAGLFIVGTDGGNLGLVRAGSTGVSVLPIDSIDRTRPNARLVLEGAAIERLDLGAETVGRLMDALAIIYASDACGAAHRALEMALEYARVRKQFDKLIGQFQGLKYQLVNMAVEVNPCRPLSWYAAHAWDAIPGQSARMAAVAKAHITEVAVRAARGCVEVHGGIGYTWEYPLHVWLKRAMHDRAMVGQPSAHRGRSATLAGW